MCVLTGAGGGIGRAVALALAEAGGRLAILDRSEESAVIPGGRIGQPEDIAQAVLFLARPRSASITGDEITVDGGYTRNIISLVPRAGYARDNTA